MPSVKITKAAVDAIQPAARDRVYWDKDIAGFGLKVTPVGRKVYLYRYRIAPAGKAAQMPPITIKIGNHGEVTPDQARGKAKELAGTIAAGGDPRAEKRKLVEDDERTRRERETAFDLKAAQWLEHYEYEKERRPSSVAQARLVVRRFLKPALGSKPLTLVKKADIQSIIDGIPVSQRAMRRAVFAYTRVLFGWATSRGYIDRNPLQDMDKPSAPKHRDRVLNDEELTSIWRAAEELQPPFGPFYRLLILTGQRRDEVASLCWADLDRPSATWTIPAARTKNGQAHIVPLSAEVVAQLDCLAGSSSNWPTYGYVFTTTGTTSISGFSKAKRTLDVRIAASKAVSMPEWRVHDLRRTLATGLQRLGVRFEVTEAVLNHISGSKSGVAGIYQRHDWKDEKRAALTAWAAHVEQLVNDNQPSNVIKLAGTRM